MLQQSYDTHYIALPEQDKQTTKRENTLEWGNSFYWGISCKSYIGTIKSTWKRSRRISNLCLLFPPNSCTIDSVECSRFIREINTIENSKEMGQGEEIKIEPDRQQDI